jgi:hypothetical protein
MLARDLWRLTNRSEKHVSAAICQQTRNEQRVELKLPERHGDAGKNGSQRQHWRARRWRSTRGRKVPSRPIVAAGEDSGIKLSPRRKEQSHSIGSGYLLRLCASPESHLQTIDSSTGRDRSGSQKEPFHLTFFMSSEAPPPAEFCERLVFRNRTASATRRSELLLLQSGRGWRGQPRWGALRR